MITKNLFAAFLIAIGVTASLSSTAQTDAASTTTNAAEPQPMQVWEKIRALRRMSENGIIPELESRGLTEGFSETTKWAVTKDIATSDEFNNIQAIKVDDVIAMLQCLQGRPIQKATIKPECVKSNKLDMLVAHADELLRREDQIMRAAADKYRKKPEAQ